MSVRVTRTIVDTPQADPSLTPDEYAQVSGIEQMTAPMGGPAEFFRLQPLP